MKDAKGHGSNPRGAHAEGVMQVGTLPVGLGVRAGPSKEVRGDPRAAGNAHEIQLVENRDGGSVLDKGGVQVHYRGEVTEEKPHPVYGNEWGVGYVENVSQEHHGLGEALYKQMARYVEQHGGKLVAGMNTNRTSRAVLDKLQKTGYATPYKRGEHDLIQVHSTKKQ